MRDAARAFVFLLVCFATCMSIQAFRKPLAIAQNASGPTLDTFEGNYDLNSDPYYQNGTPGTFTTNAVRVGKSKSVQTATIDSASLIKFEINVADRQVMVAATALLQGNNSNIRYVWRLRTYAANNSIFASRDYIDQAFSMDGDGSMEPSFADVIDVPPGESHVVLSLYAVPKGTSLKIINDDKKAFGFLAARSGEMISSQ